jgi:allantoinase
MSHSPDLAITSQRVITPDGEKAAAVLIKDEKILDVLPIDDIQNDCPIEDMGNDVVMPGLVDVHVHINEPGRTDWEGFETATKAACAGGITTLVDMPLNCSPVTTNMGAFNAKITSTQKKLWVDCGFYGGLIPDNLHEIESLAKAGVLGFKAFMSHSGIDEFPKVSEQNLRDILFILAKYNLPLLVHAELEDGDNTTDDLITYESYMATRPKSWENNAIKLLISLCAEFQTPIHIVHLSSSEILNEISSARENGLPITVETCPHYLHFTAEKIADGDTRFKCAPPIRDANNREQLWRGLKSGIIDFITSDHSPCQPELKKLSEGRFDKAWGGISSVQLTLPIIWSECKNEGLSLAQLTNWLCDAPAKFIGMNDCKGQILPGKDADITCWDPDESFLVEPAMIHYKHKLTPYDGEQLFGVVKKTFLRGNKIFDNNRFTNGPLGKPLYSSYDKKN